MAKIKKATITKTKGGLKYVFADGKKVEVNVKDLTKEIQQEALLHGLKQKLSDSYAGFKTDHEIFSAFESTLNVLLNGAWNGGRSSQGGIWVEALARASGRSIEEALETWNGLDDKKIKDLKKHAGIRAAKAEIELERAQAKAGDSEGFDLDSL